MNDRSTGIQDFATIWPFLRYLKLSTNMSSQRGTLAESPSSPPPPKSPLKLLRTPRRSASPDYTCPICLSEVVNKSVTNTCMHEFCFCCLQEWSRIKAECPLCKQRFTKIYHSIQSLDVYEEHILEQNEGPRILDPILINFQILTNARLRAPLMLLLPPREHSGRSTQHGGPGSNPSFPLRSMSPRRRIYEENLWALPLRSPRSAMRIRESSPQFYRSNPAQTHRLIPWLQRELHVLLHMTNVDLNVVVSEILQAIQMYSIRSRLFSAQMRRYLGQNTAHFVHEFYRYAVAPFDMDLYDMCVEYSSNIRRNADNSLSDSDSDVEMVRFPPLSLSNVPLSTSTSTVDGPSIVRPSAVRLNRPTSSSSSAPVCSCSPRPSSPLVSYSLDDDTVGGNSSVSTIPASPVLSSSSRGSPEVIVIPSTPSDFSPISPSYSPIHSSDSDIQILSPPPRAAPIVITIDESSEEEKKVSIKAEPSPKNEESPEIVAGPSGTSGQHLSRRRSLSCNYRESFSTTSSEEELKLHADFKRKRKLNTKKQLPLKKRSRRWSTSDDSSDDSDLDCSKKKRESTKVRRESKHKRKWRIPSSSSSSES